MVPGAAGMVVHTGGTPVLRYYPQQEPGAQPQSEVAAAAAGRRGSLKFSLGFAVGAAAAGAGQQTPGRHLSFARQSVCFRSS